MILKEYTQDIYPFSIWIAICSNPNLVTRRFISLEHHEPFEYLVGYIANCCEKTKNYKKRRVKTTKKGE